MANQRDIDRARAGDKNLAGADLSGASLDFAVLYQVNLVGANLAGAKLRGAGLVAAQLVRADFSDADLTKAMIGYANLLDANLTRANLSSASLPEANLAEANLAGACLNDADLRGAKIRGANLYGATLKSAKLSGADMTRANLTGANLYMANLSHADLTGTNLTFAIFNSADLYSANLSGAAMNSAKLSHATLGDAYLVGTRLRGADLLTAYLHRADLTDADLTGARLASAILSESILVGASLAGANLRSADLTGADLTGADLTEANLTGAILTGANLRDANLTGVVGYDPPAQPERRRTSGRATGTALKLGAADVPADPREFKKLYPKEFDLLARRGLAGRPFRPEAVAAIQKQLASPVEWSVTRSKYTSDAQRYCATPNDVLLLNIDLGDSSLTERQRAALRRLAEVSRRSGHPHEKGHLFTIGWVRYCAGDGVWLIEEVQSDVQVARTGLKDPETRTKLASAGIDAESFEEAIAALAPYTEAFYHDAIGLVFEMAKAEGVEVEMLEYEAKREFGSPRGIYTDLPREMGMTMREGSRVLPDESDGIEQVWAYRPNPARRREFSRVQSLPMTADAKRVLETFIAGRGRTAERAIKARYDFALMSDRSDYRGRDFRFAILPKDGVESYSRAYPGYPSLRPRLDENDVNYALKTPSGSIGSKIPEIEGMVYRGMSWEEWQSIRKNCEIRSRGEWNIGQPGLTFFGDADTALYYATGFAPWMFKPSKQRPGIVIAIPRRYALSYKDSSLIPESEFATRGGLSASVIERVWRIVPTEIRGGFQDITVGHGPYGKIEYGSGSGSGLGDFVVVPSSLSELAKCHGRPNPARRRRRR